MRAAGLVAIALVAVAGSAVFAAEPTELEPLAFLVGEWSSPPGAPESGSGTAVFTRSLQDRVILRTSYAEYPAAAGKPKSRHDDLMVIYAVTGDGVRAEYFDNEGHVIRYAVRSPAPGEAVFVSDAQAGTPRFRLSYRLEATGVLKGEFAIAPPGAPEAFQPYLAWESRKATGPAK
jgi:hypothetical protein